MELLFKVLHISALNNLNRLIEHIFEKIMLRQSVVKSKIAEFVNSPTDEGFTALHFAAFRGNVVRYRISNMVMLIPMNFERRNLFDCYESMEVISIDPTIKV